MGLHDHPAPSEGRRKVGSEEVVLTTFAVDDERTPVRKERLEISGGA